MTALSQRMVPSSQSRPHRARELMATALAVGLGVGLAFGLVSPLQALAIGIAGIGVYVLFIFLDPLKGLLLWLVTQQLLDRYLNISLGAGIPDLSLTRVCIGLVSVLLLARACIRIQRLQPMSKFDVLAVVYMIGMMQSGPRGLRGIASVQNVFDLHWVPVLICFAVKNLVTDRRSMHLVLYALLCVAIYSAAYAVYESVTGNVLLAPSGYGTTVYGDSGLHILRGIWGSNVAFGRVFVLAIPSLFYFYLKAPSLSRKTFFAMCLALVFAGLYLTYKRGAWLGMIVTVFVMQLFYPQFRRLFIVLLIIVSAALAFNWDDVSTSAVYTDRINSQNSTSEGRTKGWEHAMDFWSASPLIGRGFQQYRNLAQNAGYRDDAVESEYFEILVSAGLVGFLPYIGVLLMMIYDGFLLYRGKVADGLADRDLVTVLWGMVAGFAVTISTSTVSYLVVPSMLFAAAGAILYSRRSCPKRCESKVVHPV